MERTAATKRKAPLSSLQRRVRARKDEPEDVPSDQSQREESSEDEGSEGQSDKEEDEDNAESDESSEEDEDEAEDPSTAASQISFGALAKAQASLPNTRRGKGRKGQQDDEEEEENDKRHRDPRSESKSKSKSQLPHRTNKHAPTEQSSKRQVTRRREVVATHKPVARDPRFSAAVQGRPIDEDRLRRAYGFLDEYRDSEMAQLRDAAKKTKDAGAKEELKRALASMEGKKKAQQAREAERKLIEEHRKREKELVKQGKKPFYLKKSEQKKQLLVDRFAGLKGKQVDRVIERRRKKLASKEKKNMPMERRERS